jgi:hypothetical protein
MSDYYYLWVTPSEGQDASYVPSPDVLTALLGDLADSKWIAPDRPFSAMVGPPYVAHFHGAAVAESVRPGDPRFDMAEVTLADPTLRATHFRSVSVLVTESIRLAPTVDAAEIEVACAECGASPFPSDEDDEDSWGDGSRPFPGSCPDCGVDLSPADYGHLPLYRFALRLEPWYATARGGLRADTGLLKLLRRRTGIDFDAAGQYPF